MSTIYHLVNHVKKYGQKHRILYLISTMVLFWAVFDGIITYVSPLLITERGFSKTEMGMIIGFSSAAGGIFDFLMCRIFRNAKHRRILIIMFILSFVYPLILLQAHTLFLFLIAMVIWGLYYDLHQISNFEFVGNHIEKEEHSSSFGVIHVFQSLGYLLAPIFAGAVIGIIVDWKPFAFGWIFLSISLIFFIVFSLQDKREKEEDLMIRENCRPINFLLELSLWHRIGKTIAPVLFLTLMLNLIRAFFWTAGPLYAESFAGLHQFAGFFMVAFSLPPLLVGWMVGNITAKHGKKKTAFYALLIGSAILGIFGIINSLFFTILIVFVASFFISFAWPAINGAYADYISESKMISREIEGLELFFANLGNIIGPILAGVLADMIGNRNAFPLLGLLGAIVAIILLKITPRNIRINKAMETPSHFAIINELEVK